MMTASKPSDKNDRFSRIRLLIGKDKLLRLHKAKVTVIGLGAVGAQAVEALARAGVGSFRLVDFDIIRPSNINRHIWATEETLGRSKSIVALERLKLIDPKIKVEALELFAAQETLDRILDNKPDLVIDAIDSLNPKGQTLAGCYHCGLSVISSMGAATRTDPSKIKVADLFDTRTCPLAARMRDRLRKLKVGKGITCVYSDEEQNTHALSDEALARDEGELKRGRLRRTLGSLPTVTGIFGLTIANAAIEKLCHGWK
jgi:tRNA A37 threonylcarbamoyladenosine dehydratase